MHLWKHFKTITHHKLMVMKGCFSVGLYRQGLLHDLSKYMPSEFIVGAKYYQGTQSPNNAERKDKGYSSAWLHHKGRNKHHYEYWLDYSTKNIPGGMAPAPMPNRYIVEMLMDRIGAGIIPARMPDRYVVEMFIDRMAASKNYAGKNYKDDMPLKYYQSGNPGNFMHKETRKTLEKLLKMLAAEGEDKTMHYIRKKMIPQIKKSKNQIHRKDK